jgi:di/tricarboxylate transporter
MTPLVGKTVTEANLMEFPGFHLARTNRRNREIAPVPESLKLREGDHLFYAPAEEFSETPSELADYPGLRLAVEPPRKIKRDEKLDRELHQVVVKEGSRLVGSTVEQPKILERFGAAVTGCVTAGIFHIALAGILGVAVLIASKAIEAGKARQAIDWSVLIVIGSALALGKAMEVSGAAAEGADTKTPLNNVFTALVILTTLLFLTILFYYLPMPILAAIIIVSVFGLVDVEEILYLRKVKNKRGRPAM